MKPPFTTALVTGASSGIGKAIAEQLVADGLTVYGAARRVDRMADLEKLGVVPIAMDVTDEARVAAAVAEIEAEQGAVGVLVNNAGYGSYGAMEDTPLDEARRQFEVNLFGLAAVTKAVLPEMRRQGRGRIINISSMGGRMYTPLGSWYHATKHALEGWSDCLRLELEPFGIDVVVVEPGVILTEFSDTMLGPMMERSGASAYAPLARRMAEATRAFYAEGAASPASVIAEVVSEAVAAPKPKTRYVAGKRAKSLMWARKWLGDRMFDRAVMASLPKS